MPVRPTQALAVRRCGEGKGRGLFALRPFEAGALIERAPVLVVPAAEREHLDATMLYDYYFGWGEAGEAAAFALGYCSYANHSYAPNAVYVKKPREGAIELIARRAIAAGEEITVNYNGDPEDTSRLWFPVVG